MSNVSERTVNIGLIVLPSTNLDHFLAQEVGGGVQHVGGVSGVVVGVGRVVAALHQLQPRAQRRLRAVEELAHAEAGEDLQAEVSQRSARGDTCNQQIRALHVQFLPDFTQHVLLYDIIPSPILHYISYFIVKSLFPEVGSKKVEILCYCT